MIKKLNLRLILLECLALVFIISGIDRQYIAFHGEKFDALFSDETKKFTELSDITIGEFFLNQLYWTLTAIIIGITIVVFVNWKNKFGVINSIVVSILTLAISATGIYSGGLINTYLNYFCGIFAEGYGMAFLIGGLIILLVGIFILWKTIDLNNKNS